MSELLEDLTPSPIAITFAFARPEGGEEDPTEDPWIDERTFAWLRSLVWLGAALTAVSWLHV